MEAKDLRIGNWVLFGEAKMEIDANDFKDCDANGLMHQLYKPIPLTEEWLVKFEQKDLDLFILEIEVNWNIKIKYVHQLQNLYFALTGEELTIKE